MQRFENKFHHDQSPFEKREYYGIDEWFHKDFRERGYTMQGDNLDKLTIARTAKDKRALRRTRPLYSVLYVAIAVSVVIFIAWLFLSKGQEVRVGSVSRVYPAQLLAKLRASGYVVAQRKADVAAKVTGQLTAIMVEEGSLVKKGQVIARLESADVATQVDQVRANLRAAQARVEQIRADMENTTLDYERKKKLVSSGAVSRAEYDAAESRYFSAKASLDAARSDVQSSAAALRTALITLSYYEIRSPFDAVVLTKNADVGDIITPFGAAANAKAAVVSIADLSSLQVEVDVSESNIGLVRVGLPCDILLDALPDDRFQGVVDTIVPTVDKSKATVLVKVRFSKLDPRILPEMSAKVGFLSKELKPDELKPRTMMSVSALKGTGAREYAFVVQGQRVHKKEVRTGMVIGDMVEVKDGLKPGDTVVITPPKGLSDNSKITIIQQ
jgi:RND family efflux transporter MFP subunit